MILVDENGRFREFPMDYRLLLAKHIGAIRIDSLETMRATILPPPGFENFSDDEILSQLEFASDCGARLERLGFDVTY